MKENEVNELPMQVLAFVGDSVYTLKVREYLVTHNRGKSGLLHKLAIKFVSAVSQARVLKKLETELTEEEADIVRRGRNTYTASVPKHADIIDYKYSTAFESLLGYLYLSGKVERMDYLIDICINEISAEEKIN